MTTNFRALLADDAYAVSFQSLGQYRTALLKALDATPPPELPTDDFLKSYPEVTRVEVITNKGREFVRYECSTVQVSFQDDGQTIKVFLFSTYD